MGPTSASSSGATQEQVRRQYRRIAAHVHPDKCDLGGAEGAFVRISHAHDQLLQQYNSRTGAGASSSCAFGRGAAAAASAADAGSTSDWQRDGQSYGFEWWGRWDAPDMEGVAAQQFAWSTQPTREHQEGRLWDIPMEVRMPGEESWECLFCW